MFVEDWNMAFVGRLKLFRQDILHVILATRVVYYGANGHVIFGGGYILRTRYDVRTGDVRTP